MRFLCVFFDVLDVLLADVAPKILRTLMELLVALELKVFGERLRAKFALESLLVDQLVAVEQLHAFEGLRAETAGEFFDVDGDVGVFDVLGKMAGL